MKSMVNYASWNIYPYSNNRWLPLQYGNSTKYGNVEKRVKHPKNDYLLITFFNGNFWRVSLWPIPKHNSVWNLNGTRGFNGGDFGHIHGFYGIVDLGQVERRENSLWLRLRWISTTDTAAGLVSIKKVFLVF